MYSNSDYTRARYQYDLKVVRDRVAELKRRVGGATLFYSVKANHNLEVLREIANSRSMEAEVCSVGEMKAVAEVGFDVSKIIFGGPGKRARDMKEAIEFGVSRFSIESLHELMVLESVEKELSVCVFKILRIAPPSRSSAKLSMAGPESKFGLTIDEVVGLRPSSRAGIQGIHVYFGSQASESDCFGTNVQLVNNIAKELQESLPDMQFINYGGGLAWPYLSEGDSRVTGKTLPETLPGFNTAFEFGRYVVASCGTLRTCVVDRKMRNNRQILILESGLHHLAGIAATGRIMRNKISFRVASSKARFEGEVPTAIYGPLCTPLDYFDLDVALPPIDIGDELVIPNAGAYAFPTRMADFLLREPVEEVCV